MPLKLNVSVCRKEGRENYGSEGATCSIEIEAGNDLADNPEALHAKVRALYRLCDRAVADQLAGGNSGPAQPPARRPDPEPEPPPPRRANANANGYGGRGGYDEPPPRTRVNGKGFDGDPKTGKALFKWLKEQDGLYDLDLVKWCQSWAKLQQYPGRFDEWNADEVACGVRAVRDRIGLVERNVR